MMRKNSPARLRQITSLALVWLLTIGTANAGILISQGDGITLSGADGITLSGADGITLSGADGFLTFGPNGITLSGADGITLSGADGVGTFGADGITLSGADGVSFAGSNGVTATGADGITLSGADGITLSGADGITLSGADGTQHRVDSVAVSRPSGITLSGADTFAAYGVNGVTLSGADGITLSGADGITLSGADTVTISSSDGVTARALDGRTFQASPNGITLSGADTVIATGAVGASLSGADSITRTGAAAAESSAAQLGLRSVDPELAVTLDRMTDDSTVNAVVVFHRYPSDTDLADLQRVGVISGTRFRALPMVYVTGTRAQIVEISRLRSVRSIYGNRTLQLTVNASNEATGVKRARTDADLTRRNAGLPLSGRGVTVAVLDTGIDATHADLAGRVVRNVKLLEAQTAGVGFAYPAGVEALPNTDQAHGHGTFVAGVVGGSGARSGGLYTGVAPNAKLVGLSAGDLSLVFVLSGLDYVVSRGGTLGVRVLNCSFSSNTVYDANDPVNVATKMLADRGVNVVFSAGNTGPGLHTLNPYAAAPWVVSVGATDGGRLASFSSRGSLGSQQFRPTLVAPGARVVSLRSSGVSLTGAEGPGFNSDTSLAPAHLPYYTTATGTSFSAPQVAGVIALMLEANPQLTPAQVKDILQRTATPLPPYFSHEVGAGMLNAHAAVLESAFPARRMGQFRATVNEHQVRFVADSPQVYTGTVAPNATGYENAFNIPEGTLLASVQVGWGPIWSPNDLGMALFDASGAKRADVNTLNLAGLSGKRERALLTNPSAGAWTLRVRNTLGVAGTPQEVAVALEILRAEYPNLRDVGALSAPQREDINLALRSFVMSPVGQNFRPSSAVTRSELAAALVRGGRVPQYTAQAATFRDVNDQTTRLYVESCHYSPRGALFPDAAAGEQFSPQAQVSRLATAVALVRAAGLRAEAESKNDDPLLWLTDAGSVPANMRGYVSVAISRKLLPAEGMLFRPQSPLTRLELARSMAVMQELLTK
ncbi:MAG TPA: S8 family serine peptidase [Pyrinomonadaceae bacterium]|nr:S8 family serine peptidase [Pyrinomonadaceae bacterium]